MNWRLIKTITIAFLGLLLLAVVADVLVYSFVEYGHKDTDFAGCYAYDAMIVGFECQGFTASNIISLWLNWPLALIYAPIFAVFSIRAFAIAILVWLPLITYIVSLVQLHREINTS